MGTKLLICGATGFIGRNLAEHFAADSGMEVHGTHHESPAMENSGVAMIRANLTRKADVKKAMRGMDVVIQAAATTSGARDIISKPWHHVTDNAVMNSLIFRAAFEQQVRHVVFFSCTVMYPSSEKPLREQDFDANVEMYRSYFGAGWTKVYIEKMCEFYARLGRTRFTAIRHSNIYGPYDKYDLERSHVFGATVAKVMTATGNRMTVWGKGEEKRDLMYVSDLVRFVQLAIERQATPFALYNAGYGSAISVRDLAAKIILHSGRELTVEHDLSRPSLQTALCLDCSKARQELGWWPEVSLDDGIRKTLLWYGKQRSVGG